MSVVHRITGYDKETEFIAQEFDIPPEGLAEARRLAKIDPGIVDMIGAYPLDQSAAQAVKDRFNFGMWVEGCDWFIEPFAT